MKIKVTVRYFIEYCLPHGSRGEKGDWSKYPRWPLDLFALTASLIQNTGGYTYLLSDNEVNKVFTKGQQSSNPENRMDIDVGHFWSGDLFNSTIHENMLELWWSKLSNCDAELSDTTKHPEWVPFALLILIASDHTCSDANHDIYLRESSNPGWIQVIYHLMSLNPSCKSLFYDQKNINWWLEALKKIEQTLVDEVSGKSKNRNDEIRTHSGCILIPEDIACVHFKTSVPSVGCSIRNLTQNLALLPPAGEVKVTKTLTPIRQTIERSTFNILVVPYPFQMSGKDFKVTSNEKDKIARFSISQSWLTSNSADEASDNYDYIVNMLERLIDSSGNHVNHVDAIVLPELALNEPAYNAILAMLQQLFAKQKREPNNPLFFISGVSSVDPQGRLHNTASTSILYSETKYVKFSQDKHHRWRLDENQIKAYSIADSLNPNISWLEDIDITQRVIETTTFRPRQTLVTLICEDLARFDPCQSVIRALGPNLVLALLMDGPQLVSRWPARYAMGLSDDPGCSVLSITSLALVNRSNHTFNSKSRSIALWRDGRGHMQELNLPEGNDALLLTLSEKIIDEKLLDGRSASSDRTSWQLAGITPLSSGLRPQDYPRF